MELKTYLKSKYSPYSDYKDVEVELYINHILLCASSQSFSIKAAFGCKNSADLLMYVQYVMYEDVIIIDTRQIMYVNTRHHALHNFEYVL